MNKYFKRCFTCRSNKPLFLYSDNHMKYKLPSDKGKMVNCRICETKYFINNKGNVVRYDFTNRKFVIKNYKVNFLTILKTYLK